jgi:hypothetical protein
MHNNTHVQVWADFFLAYGQQQATLAQHLSAQAELGRKTRALYPSLAKEYRDDMPSKLVVDSPYGTLLITIDTSREIILKIEEIEKFNTSDTEQDIVISQILSSLNCSQLAGLNTLLFLSIREKSSIAYQYKEWAFTDIPSKVIYCCDNLDNKQQLKLAIQIAEKLFTSDKNDTY